MKATNCGICGAFIILHCVLEQQIIEITSLINPGMDFWMSVTLKITFVSKFTWKIVIWGQKKAHEISNLKQISKHQTENISLLN